MFFRISDFWSLSPDDSAVISPNFLVEVDSVIISSVAARISRLREEAEESLGRAVVIEMEKQMKKTRGEISNYLSNELSNIHQTIFGCLLYHHRYISLLFT